MHDHDWGQVREKVARAAPGWFHLGDDQPYTLAETIRQGALAPMRGVEVRTRNTRREQGKRFCSIYLREDPDAGSANRGSADG